MSTEKLDDFANKIANTFSRKYSLRKNDVVALFMENKPEYIGIWLGLAKIGAISALINVNLKQKALIHSVITSNAKILIYGSELGECMLALHFLCI